MKIKLKALCNGDDGKCCQCGGALEPGVGATCIAWLEVNRDKLQRQRAERPAPKTFEEVFGLRELPKTTSTEGLGDYTERMLISIGVTKERYIAAKELFGLAPTCGCAARKEWLNKVSAWWSGNG